jgi:hypothetical protein
MGLIKLDIPHTLGLEEAKVRVNGLLDYWTRKYGVKIAWTGDKATFDGKVMGIHFSGYLTVLAQKVSGEASDPGMLLRGQATKYLVKKFGDYLDPKKSLGEVQQHLGDA